MALLKHQILKLLKKPQLACLATVTRAGTPWVRYVTIVTDHDLTIRFPTHIHARKVAHISYNSDVHLTCGANTVTYTIPFLQIQGRATFSTERADRHHIWHKRWKNVFDGPNDPSLGVIIVRPTRIEYCAEETLTWISKG